MALYVWYLQSFHSHHLQDSFRRCFCNKSDFRKKQSRFQYGRIHSLWNSFLFQSVMEVNKPNKYNLRFLPPRISTVWTKYRWSSGVHRSRGSSDLLYCRTPILSDEQDFIFFCRKTKKSNYDDYLLQKNTESSYKNRWRRRGNGSTDRYNRYIKSDEDEEEIDGPIDIIAI